MHRIPKYLHISRKTALSPLVGIGLVLALLAGCASPASSPPSTPAASKPAGSPSATSNATSSPAVTPAATKAAGSPSPTTGPASQAAGQVTLVEYGAGTLSVPFKSLNDGFQKANPNVTVQAQFGGSVKMAKQITELHQPADVLAVADYNVIPQQLYSNNGSKADANWYVGFAANAITFVYTDKSKGASEINADNWYKVLAEPGVQIGRSNPDTDPSGYQTLQMLSLAETYYNQPGLAQAILKNAPQTNIRDTETELIGALESGQIDYLAIYLSDALQHKFKYLQLPPQINLSDASQAADYAKVTVHTSNGDLKASPIIYAVTIPFDAPHPQQAQDLVKYLLGDAGQGIMKQNGFVSLNPPIASGLDQVPSGLKSMVKSWPVGP